MFERFSHKRRVEDLEERFEKLQRDFHALELEWSNVFDKMRMITGRMAKRAALAQEKEDLLMGKDAHPVEQDGADVAPGKLTALPSKAAVIREQLRARRQSGG